MFQDAARLTLAKARQSVSVSSRQETTTDNLTDDEATQLFEIAHEIFDLSIGSVHSVQSQACTER